MNRRDLLKAIGLLGATAGMSKSALAGVSARQLRNARAIVDGEINFTPPATLPTVINVFMYGGPSELAGNLTNIAEINSVSQNPYTDVRGDILTPFDSVSGNGQITARGFWADAAGHTMEDLVAANQLTVYRTINRVVDDNKAHRESIFSAQTGGVKTMESPGMGTTLAAMLRVKMPSVFDNPDDTPILPFVTFEGDTVLYDQGDIDSLPLWLRSVSLDNNFANPYQRKRIGALGTISGTTRNMHKCIVDGQALNCSDALDALAALQSSPAKFERFAKAMSKRDELDRFFSSSGSLSNPAAKVPAADVDGVPFDTQAFVTGSGQNQGIRTFSNGFGASLRAAVVLALENPDTRFITLSTGGLGGWDDHDNAIADYETRISNLFSDLRTAVRLLRTGTTTAPARNDVVINVYGEFGRNVNLNGSMGWDHGNNMNLYTLGGSGIANRALGKVVGSTKWIGTPGQNRLFTSPADGSLQWEPFSIAATVYQYFGVNNPEVLTRDTDMQGAENGFGAIDGFAGAPPLTA